MEIEEKDLEKKMLQTIVEENEKIGYRTRTKTLWFKYIWQMMASSLQNYIKTTQTYYSYFCH